MSHSNDNLLTILIINFYDFNKYEKSVFICSSSHDDGSLLE